MRRFLFEPESDSECESEDEDEEFELDDDADVDDVCLLRLFCFLEDESSLCKRLAISELFASIDLVILDKTVRIWDDLQGHGDPLLPPRAGRWA